MLDMKIIRERLSLIKENIDIVKNSGRICIEAINQISDALDGFHFNTYVDIFDSSIRYIEENIEEILSSHNVDVVSRHHIKVGIEMRLSTIANTAREFEEAFKRKVFPSQEYVGDWHKLFAALNIIITKASKILKPVKQPSLTI